MEVYKNSKIIPGSERTLLGLKYAVFDGTAKDEMATDRREGICIRREEIEEVIK